MSAASLRPSFYVPSGLVPLSAWILVAVVLLPLAALCGMLYCASTVLITAAKLRWIGSIGLGWALGMLSAKVCRLAKVRANLFAMLATAVALLVAYYAAWGIHRTLYAAIQFGVDAPLGRIFVLGFLPSEIAAWMSQLVRRGGVAGLAGVPLVGVWLIELGAIAYFTRATFLAAWDDRPYCEQCEAWTADPEELIQLPVSPSDSAWEAVEELGPKAIRKLQLKPDGSERVVLSVVSCPQCDRSHYLSASGGGWAVRDSGELSYQDVTILRHMAVSRDQIDEIQQLGELLEEAYQELRDEPPPSPAADDPHSGPEIEPERV